VKDLDGVYEKVVAEIRAQYAIGYVSTNEKTDGAWRKVEVEVARKEGDLRRRARGDTSRRSRLIGPTASDSLANRIDLFRVETRVTENGAADVVAVSRWLHDPGRRMAGWRQQHMTDLVGQREGEHVGDRLMVLASDLQQLLVEERYGSGTSVGRECVAHDRFGVRFPLSPIALRPDHHPHSKGR